MEGGLLDGTILARATVHLQGLPVGATARVDPRDPYIAELLEATFLVPIAVEQTVAGGTDSAAEIGRGDDDVDG